MEVRCNAPDDRAITLCLEPWGEEQEVPQGSFLRLVIQSAGPVDMELSWADDGLVVWPPSQSVVSVLTAEGNRLGEDILPRQQTP